MILLGEYAVLEGAPALVCAVDSLAEVSCTDYRRGEFMLHSPAIDIMNIPFVVTGRGRVRFDPRLDDYTKKRLRFFKKLFEYGWGRLSLDAQNYRGLQIRLDTGAFYSSRLNIKLGFGSSAAMTVALLAGLFESYRVKLGSDQLLEHSLIAHHLAQGKLGSGIDIAASCLGGVVRFQLDEEQGQHKVDAKNISLWPDLFIIPVWTGNSTNTRTMLRGIERLKTDQPEQYAEVIERLSSISLQGCRAYEDQDEEIFMKSVHLYENSLRELGQSSGLPIISGKHQELADLAWAEGAAYKPSGAGGGDIGLAFTTNEQIKEKLIQKFSGHDCVVLDVQIAHQGAVARQID